MRHPHVALHELKQFVKIHDRSVLCEIRLPKNRHMLFERPVAHWRNYGKSNSARSSGLFNLDSEIELRIVLRFVLADCK
jgi:hypothetical protein